MNYRIILTVLVLSFAFSVQSCGDLEKCKSSQEVDTTVLVDVTDPKLIDQIDEEMFFFPAFAKAKQLLKISECGSASLSIAPISSDYKLKILTDSIALRTGNITGNQKKERLNPEPLYASLQDNFNEIKVRVEQQPELQAASDLGSVIAKTLIRLSESDNATVIILSDFVVYQEQFNFYKRVPAAADAKEALSEMMGPTLYSNLQEALQTGAITEIYLVTLTPPTKIAKSRMDKIYAFWETSLTDLGLAVVLTDSLNNL